MYTITILANCIDICNNIENNILKSLLFDYVKHKLNKKEIIVLYLKIACVNRKTKLYEFLNEWIKIYQNKMIKQLLYYEY
tara:strand:- start:8 stop:247 length:240 start_codon:yes stop_codon:yes gene_type:complete